MLWLSLPSLLISRSFPSPPARNEGPKQSLSHRRGQLVSASCGLSFPVGAGFSTVAHSNSVAGRVKEARYFSPPLLIALFNYVQHSTIAPPRVLYRWNRVG